MRDYAGEPGCAFHRLRSGLPGPLEDSSGVTGAAKHAAYGFQINGMSKPTSLRRNVQPFVLVVIEESVARRIAIVAYHPAVRADVLAVVTTEAAGVVQVPDIVGMGVPVALRGR